MKAAIIRQMMRFIVVGGLAVAIDGVAYYLLDHQTAMGPSWAKRVSFALGSVWAFFMNKYFTFKQRTFRPSEPVLFAVVYLAGWFLNSVAHDVVFKWTGLKLLAFLVATGLSTCNNFAGQKWIVFRTGRVKAAKGI